MLTFLYNIIIYPLFQIIELIYSLCFSVLKNPGLSIFGVSFAVSFLCLPLYIIAEKWQEKERQIQFSMQDGIKRIKKAFKGDEQYMILTAYYKENNYHPVMALRSSISLLIQIPFFIAAYQFLSHLSSLNGQSFLFIKDMGKPDCLFKIGSFPVNILPIAMTLINVTSGIIYSKGHPLKEKLQIYIMAAFFLVFLYNSPSGLVIYWTMNNIFSLVKNVFYKLKNPLKVLYFCLCAGVLCADWYLLFMHTGFFAKRLSLVLVLCIIPLTPLIVKGIKYLLQKPLKEFNQNNKGKTIIFYSTSILLAILTGFILPSFIIASSPMEFSFIDEYTTPLFFLRNSLTQAIGFCIFWPTCFYFLFGKEIKSVIAILFSILCFAGLINAFAFGGDYGNISTILTFNNAARISPQKLYSLLNLLCCLILIGILFILFKYNKTKIVSSCAGIICFSLIILGFVNSSKIRAGFKEAEKLTKNKTTVTDVSPIFHLSKTQKNVIVIMQDRAISGFLPFILEEKPELKEYFTGFTYYPNTVSFGGNTLYASPALYGGYEYTPAQMNKKDKESLVSKHNQALQVMPLIFSENGFDSTVTDLSWANYSWIPDLSIFDKYPQINLKPTIRVYNDVWQKNHPEINNITKRSVLLKRNFLWFSFFKIMVPQIRTLIYKEGNWWRPESSSDYINDFLNSYAVLDLLPSLFDFENSKPSFTLLVNEATHEPLITGYPDYNLTSTETGSGIFQDNSDYHVNISAITKLAEFFNYLKQSGYYDNTKIILVADHGYPNCLAEYDNTKFKYVGYNPLLMVKDFNSSEPLKTDNTFMTNADTPLLAFKDIIENPINPNTGNELKKTVNKETVYVAQTDTWMPENQKKNTFLATKWYKMSKDIFNPDNWSEIIEQKVLENTPNE